MPSPQDIYGPYGSVPQGTPDVESPAGRGPRLNVEANANEMGGMIGGALQKAGQVGEHVGDQISDTALRYQGMLNETLATNAETNYMKQIGAKSANFRSLEGMAAVNALPQYINDVGGLRQDMRKDLPPGALRAFDMLAQRHEAYALNDANLYVAQQIKTADKQSTVAQINANIDNAGNLPVANDDVRFNNEVASIHFGQGRLLQNEGWDSGSGMNQNADGSHTFDETSANGPGAKAMYDQMTNTYVAKAWENRLKVLADQNVMSAYKKYQDNYDRIPAGAKPQLDAFFAPKIRDAQSRDISETVLGQATSGYQKLVYGGNSNPNNIGNVKTAQGAASNTSQFVQPATPEDGVILAANNLRSNYRGLTLQQIADKWAPPSENKTSDWLHNVSTASGIAPNTVPNLDDPGVLKSLVSGIGTAEKSPEDRSRFTSDVLDKGVQSSLTGAKPQNLEVAQNGKMVPSIADYYKSNYSNILSQSRDEAEKSHPGDIDFAEKAETKTKQRMDSLIAQQTKYDEANRDMLIKATNGDLTKGEKPQTIEQLTAISPEVKSAWDKIQVDNPQAASRIENHMVGAKNDGKLGSGFSYLQQEAYKGNLNVNDMLYHVGDDLTQEGFNKLREIVKPSPSAEERSENDQMATFLKYGHERILHSSLFHNTPEAEQAYQGWFSSVSKEIQTKKGEGASLSTLIDPQSKDYVGKNLNQFLIPVQQQLDQRADRINGRMQSSAPLPEDKKRLPGETPEDYWSRMKGPKQVEAAAGTQ